MIKTSIVIVFMMLLIVAIVTPQIYKSEMITVSRMAMAPPPLKFKPSITYNPELVLICANPNIIDIRCEKFVEKLRSDSSMAKRIIDDLPDQESRDEFIKKYKPLLERNSTLGKLNDDMQTTSTRIKNARKLILDIKQEQRVSSPQQ